MILKSGKININNIFSSTPPYESSPSRVFQGFFSNLPSSVK